MARATITSPGSIWAPIGLSRTRARPVCRPGLAAIPSRTRPEGAVGADGRGLAHEALGEWAVRLRSGRARGPGGRTRPGGAHRRPGRRPAPRCGAGRRRPAGVGHAGVDESPADLQVDAADLAAEEQHRRLGPLASAEGVDRVLDETAQQVDAHVDHLAGEDPGAAPLGHGLQPSLAGLPARRESVGRRAAGASPPAGDRRPSSQVGTGQDRSGGGRRRRRSARRRRPSVVAPRGRRRPRRGEERRPAPARR